jgi:hypothetical protein
MYAEGNPKTKKELTDAVAKGDKVAVFSPGLFPCPSNGPVSIEGPHSPAAHKWYCRAELKDGIIVRIIN